MKLNLFDIPFTGLKAGEHEFDYQLETSFFENFGFEEFNSVALDVHAVLDKRSTLMNLHIRSTGSANVDCDVTNEPFDLSISSYLKVVVKFGDTYNDENEDLLIIPYSDYKVNIAQFIYESVILSLPARKVHPGVEDGTLKSDVLERLKEMQVDTFTREHRDNSEIDPRWEALKQLKTDKN